MSFTTRDKARGKRRGGSRSILRLALLLPALAGCSTLPVQEVSDARQAISAAQAAGGERYTPETLREARRLVDLALRELSGGDYVAARAAALMARQQAIAAREATLLVQGGN